MYAIVRCGGRQEKVAVEDVLAVDKVTGEVGSTVTLPAVLVVDDGKVVSDPRELAGYEVTAEILGESRGPKLSILKYKNKTGYKRRLGHRQTFTQVKITDIAGAGKSAKKATSAASGTSASETPAKAKATTGKAAGSKAASGKASAKAEATTTARKPAAKAADKPAKTTKPKTQKPKAAKPAEGKAEEG